MPTETPVVIVTGASEGIGFATCEQLAAAGTHVAMCARRADVLEQAAGRIGAVAGSVETAVFDVADGDALVAFIRDVAQRHGRLDGLVNNAFQSLHRSIDDMTVDEWRRSYRVNVEAPFLATKTAMEAMRPRGIGSIVNVASVSGLRARANASAYCSSKAALIQFGRVAALEGGPFGIRVNTVVPGGTETASFNRAFGAVSAEEMAERGRAASPLGRFGRSEDVAEGICFLLSDASRYVTGSSLHVDGGAWLMR